MNDVFEAGDDVGLRILTPEDRRILTQPARSLRHFGGPCGGMAVVRIDIVSVEFLSHWGSPFGSILRVQTLAVTPVWGSFFFPCLIFRTQSFERELRCLEEAFLNEGSRGARANWSQPS